MKKIFALCAIAIIISGCTLTANKTVQETMTYVEINNKKMNTLVKGNGNQTIVLLSGWGTEDPINDFTPLINELSSHFRVVALEYFGYGKSDVTEKERTNKEFTEEIRSTLKNLNINPPYVLMPHSMSGLYSLYYANTYPAEVAAIVGIDASLPQKQLERWTKESFEKEKLNTNTTDLNISIIHQWNQFYDNSLELKDNKYPEQLPILSFLASEQVEAVDQMIESDEMKTSWVEINKQVMTNPRIQRLEILNGEHYLHHDQLQAIAKTTIAFITEYL